MACSGAPGGRQQCSAHINKTISELINANFRNKSNRRERVGRRMRENSPMCIGPVSLRPLCDHVVTTEGLSRLQLHAMEDASDVIMEGWGLVKSYRSRLCFSSYVNRNLRISRFLDNAHIPSFECPSKSS